MNFKWYITRCYTSACLCKLLLTAAWSSKLSKSCQKIGTTVVVFLVLPQLYICSASGWTSTKAPRASNPATFTARKCAELSEFFCMPLICVSTCNRTVQSNCIDWVTERTQITQNDVYKVNLCILIGGGWTLFGIEVVHDLEWDQPTWICQAFLLGFFSWILSVPKEKSHVGKKMFQKQRSQTPCRQAQVEKVTGTR